MSVATPLLELKKINKTFAGIHALKNVDFSVDYGEVHCLVGENGSGKSTLIKVIAGVHPVDDGEIFIHGQPFRHLRPADSMGQGIQIIYQDFSLFPNLSVAENIAVIDQLNRRRVFVRRREIHRVAEAALNKINVRLDLNALVEDLPVSSKQLVAISRALLQNARLIIMDEPTTALTLREVKSLLKVIKNLQQQGISILFVSHKLDEVMDISQKITVLRNGEKVTEGGREDFDTARLAFAMTGIDVGNARYEITPENDRKPLFSTRSLSGRGAFEDVSFDLWPGEVLGVTGLLGSGRTELALALFGLRPADRGEVFMEGKKIRIRTPQDALRHRIGYVPEDRLTEGLFLAQSIGRNISVGAIDSLTDKKGLLNFRRIVEFEREWLDRLHIRTPNPDLPVQSLSGGNQQRVVMGRWIAGNPRVLILNGPTVGVDVGSKLQIHTILRELAQAGTGIIVISDDIPEILHNCNRILLMRRGRIAEEFDSARTSEDELVEKLAG